MISWLELVLVQQEQQEQQEQLVLQLEELEH
jgi:hypothetical protein